MLKIYLEPQIPNATEGFKLRTFYLQNHLPNPLNYKTHLSWEASTLS